jgi:hypothetical protein
MKTKGHILTFCFLFSVVTAFSQTQLHVLSRTYKKEQNATAIKSLQITAEQAEVEVRVWQKNSIAYEVKLISKHPDKEQAEKDLESWKLLDEKIGKQLYLRNYMEILKSRTKPESNLRAIYVVYLPQHVSLELYNTFGKVALHGVRQPTKLNLRFCETRIIDTKSALDIQSYFGTNLFSTFSGRLTLKTDHSETVLRNSSSELKVSLLHGKLQLYEANDTVFSGIITAENTEITVSPGLLKMQGITAELEKVKQEINAANLRQAEQQKKVTLGNSQKGNLQLLMKGGTLKIE